MGGQQQLPSKSKNAHNLVQSTAIFAIWIGIFDNVYAIFGKWQAVGKKLLKFLQGGLTPVVVKMMLMSLLTARQRFKKGAFANQEDITRPDKKPILNDPDVERVRRNHLNDIENIVPFVLIGSLYVLTSPALSTALWHFRIFVAARILHTFCYEIPIPQPSRALTFFVGYGVTLSMAFSVIRASGVF